MGTGTLTNAQGLYIVISYLNTLSNLKYGQLLALFVKVLAVKTGKDNVGKGGGDG